MRDRPKRSWEQDVRIQIICLLFAVGGMPIAEAAATQLREQVSATLKKQGLTGAVWATVGLAGEIEVGATGLKDAQRGHALNPTDRVQVGSIAKPLVATGIFRLISLSHVAGRYGDIAFARRGFRQSMGGHRPGAA